MPTITTQRAKDLIDTIEEGPRGTLDLVSDARLREMLRKQLQGLGLSREEALKQCAEQTKAAAN